MSNNVTAVPSGSDVVVQKLSDKKSNSADLTDEEIYSYGSTSAVQMKSILLIILAVLGNFVGETLGCNFREGVTDNPLVKYIIVFFLIYFTVTFSSEDSPNPVDTLKGAALIWLGYFVFTKQRPMTISAVFALFASIYVMDNYTSYYERLINEEYSVIRELAGGNLPETYAEFTEHELAINVAASSSSIRDELTRRMGAIQKHNDNIASVSKWRTRGSVVILVVLAVGFVMEYRIKMKKHGSEFSVYNFLFGKSRC